MTREVILMRIKLKKMLTILCLLLVMCSFPLTVSAAPKLIVDGERMIISKNFGDNIYFYVDGIFGSEIETSGNIYPFYLTRRQWGSTPYTDKLQSFDAFCALLLNSIGADVQLANVEEFSRVASSFFDSADKESISLFISFISTDRLLNSSSSNVFYLGFSEQFLIKMEDSLSYYLNGKDEDYREFDFFFVEDPESEWWTRVGVNVLTLGSIHFWDVGFIAIVYDEGLYLKEFSIDSYSDYANSQTFSFQNMVDRFLNAIDVVQLTSWMPPAISSVYVFVFSSFFALIGVMVLLKVAHG